MASWIKTLVLLAGTAGSALADRLIDKDGATVLGCSGIDGSANIFKLKDIDATLSDTLCFMGNGQLLNVCSGEIKNSATPMMDYSLGISSANTYIKSGTYNTRCQKQAITLLKDIKLPAGIPLADVRLTNNGEIVNIKTGKLIEKLDKSQYTRGARPSGISMPRVENIDVPVEMGMPQMRARRR